MSVVGTVLLKLVIATLLALAGWYYTTKADRVADQTIDRNQKSRAAYPRLSFLFPTGRDTRMFINLCSKAAGVGAFIGSAIAIILIFVK